MTRHRILNLFRILAVPVALISIGIGLWTLENATAGLSITRAFVGETPVTIFRQAGSSPAPVVVIAHGFAGSQQLMQPFATTLARNGYVAVTYDVMGHGRNPQPMTGDVTKVEEGPTPWLVREFGRVADFAKTLPGSDGRIAVLAHSMSSDIAVRYSGAHPDVTATVAVSMFSPAVTPTAPRNLEVIVGNIEPRALKDEARRVVNMIAGGEAEPGVTYGSFADGTARRFTLSPGVEHASVLFSSASMENALDWLNKAFGRKGGGAIDARGPALGLLFFGIALLAWPLSALLPRVSVPRAGAGLKWAKLLPVAIAPAILTPLILWKLPTHFLPILLGDYITIHFALYGLLTLAGLWIMARREKRKAPAAMPSYARATWADAPPKADALSNREAELVGALSSGLMLPGPSSRQTSNAIVPIADRKRSLAHPAVTPRVVPPAPPRRDRFSLGAFILATFLVAAYSIFAFGIPLDRYLLSFSPIPERVPLILAVLAGTLPFFLADEWLTRGQGAVRGGYTVTKILFLISLAIAVALNIKKLFFLILIIPIILIFFGVYGFFSGFANRQTGNPFVAGAATALAFAWAIAVTFPLVSPQ